MSVDLEPAVHGDGPSLKRMGGPSALGGGWRRFWALTWMVAVTEFRLTYFGSVLGYFWTLMRPLMMFGVYYVVFTIIVDLGGSITNYPVLLLMNIMLFMFFAEATSQAVQSVIARESMVRKMQFPRMVIPLSVVVTSLLNLAVNLVAVFIFVLAYGVQPRWTWLILPIALIPLIMLTTGMAMLLSGLFVKYRDVAPIWGVVSQALFYASPILYVIEVPPPEIRTILEFNPLTGILEGIRFLVIDSRAPGPISAWGEAPQALIPIATIVVIFVLGFWYFNRQASTAAELL